MEDTKYIKINEHNITVTQISFNKLKCELPNFKPIIYKLRKDYERIEYTDFYNCAVKYYNHLNEYKKQP